MKQEKIEKLVITFTKHDVIELLKDELNQSKEIFTQYLVGFLK